VDPQVRERRRVQQMREPRAVGCRVPPTYTTSLSQLVAIIAAAPGPPCGEPCPKSQKNAGWITGRTDGDTCDW
jgi:hypothetical protein